MICTCVLRVAACCVGLRARHAMRHRSHATPQQTQHSTTRSTTRNTLFLCTSISLTFASTQTGQTSTELTFSSDIINKSWNAYRISPLYKFDASPDSVRKYANSLSIHVASSMPRSYSHPIVTIFLFGMFFIPPSSPFSSFPLFLFDFLSFNFIFNF